MRGVRLGDDEKSRRILVEPVHDAGPLDPADARQARPAMADQRVDQRAGRMARRRMDDEPGRLVDHDQMLVLINHGKLDVLADEGQFLRRRRLEGDPCARREPRRRIARNAFVDPHLAGLDQRLEPGARQSEAFVRPPPGPGIDPAARRRSLRRRRRPADLRAQRAGGGAPHRPGRLPARPDRPRLHGSRRAAWPLRSRPLPPARPTGAALRRWRRDEGTERRDDRLHIRPRASGCGRRGRAASPRHGPGCCRSNRR